MLPTADALVLAGNVVLDENWTFEDYDLSLVWKDPDKHLLATDVGRDDDLVLERTFAASVRGLKTRAVRVGARPSLLPSIGPSLIGLGVDRERSRFFSDGRATSVTRRTSTFWPPTRTDFVSSVTSDDPRRMTSGSFLRNHAIYQSSYFYWSELRP